MSDFKFRLIEIKELIYVYSKHIDESNDDNTINGYFLNMKKYLIKELKLLLYESLSEEFKIIIRKLIESISTTLHYDSSITNKWELDFDKLINLCK